MLLSPSYVKPGCQTRSCCSRGRVSDVSHLTHVVCCLLLLLSVCLSQRLWDLTRKGRTESAFWNRFQLQEIDTIYLEPSRRDRLGHGRRCNKVFVLIYNQILDHRGGAGHPRRY